MAEKPVKSPVEGIVHKTDSRPFMLHYTITEEHTPLALYMHCHDEIEIFYLAKGDITMHIEDNAYVLKDGDAILIPPGMLHYATKNPSCENEKCAFYAIVFSTDMLMEIVPSYCERYLRPINYYTSRCVVAIKKVDRWQHIVLDCLDNIFSEYGKDVKESELIIRGNLLIIWQLLYNNHMHELMKNKNERYLSPHLKNCVDYIDENYINTISLEELANIAGLSHGHFCRQFKEFTGYTPFSYLNKVRISHSCDMLLNTDKTIADIASLNGFNNISYYNRVFVKLMKETPSSYRKNYSFLPK